MTITTKNLPNDTFFIRPQNPILENNNNYAWTEGPDKTMLLTETTASDSLKDYPHNNKDKNAAAHTLEAFQKLAPEHQNDFLEKALKDSDVWKKADISGDAKRNRDSLKPGGGTTSAGDHKMPKLKKEELEQLMKETFGCTDEDLEKFTTIFHDAVEARAETVSIVNKLAEMVFVDHPEFALLLPHSDDDNDDLVIADALAMRVEELEDQLAYVENENDQLRESRREMRGLSEEALYSAPAKPKRSRRSISETGFNEPNEDNRVLMETENQPNQPTGAMKSYLNVLERTTRNVDHHKSMDLVEAWKLQK